MIWHDITLKLPDPYTEVLVWIDGKRGEMWANSYPLVAYVTTDGKWFEERHPSREPLVGVVAWSKIDNDI